MKGVKGEMVEIKEKVINIKRTIEAEEEVLRNGKYDWEVEELKDKEDSQVIANGLCPTGLEDRGEDLERKIELVDEILEAVRNIKNTNRMQNNRF